MATLLQLALYFNILAACFICFAVTVWIAKQHRTDRGFDTSVEEDILSEQEWEQFNNQE
ncbi:MAG: hypothetical protein ABEH65_04580 [Halobacteriales archaeon]